jgi:hypothetical protein
VGPFKTEIMRPHNDLHIRRKIIKDFADILKLSPIVISAIYAKLPYIGKASGIYSCPIVGIISGLVKEWYSVLLKEEGCGLYIKCKDVLTEDPLFISFSLLWDDCILMVYG